MIADATLPHQIVIRMQGGLIAVSCNCLRTENIEARVRWDSTAEVVTAYERYHQAAPQALRARACQDQSPADEDLPAGHHTVLALRQAHQPATAQSAPRAS